MRETEVDTPELRPHDILVDVRGLDQPVDTKVRARMNAGDPPKILGYDAAGIVRATGLNVTSFGEWRRSLLRG